jgi:stearoyl-CoA desaturase (delta-9 desaturase)
MIIDNVKKYLHSTDFEDFVWVTKTRLFWWSGWLAFLFCIFWTFYTGEWWWLAAAFITQKIISPIANGIALHRYFAHRSFKTGPLRHKFLLWISVLSAAGSPISYATQHRHHHRHTDKPTDIHSPHISLIEAAGYWSTKPLKWYQDVKKLRMQDLPRDLFKMEDVVFVHRYYYTIWMIIFVISALISWKVLFLYTLPLVGIYMFGSALFVNILSHLKIPGSYRTFESDDKSYNNKWIHNYTMQEGLHNNHHAYPSRYDQAMSPGEFDIAGWAVKKFFDIEYKKSPVTQ